jgi:uncharacterized protein (DUF1800 family)
VADLRPWEPYRPTEREPWDLRRVVHLHRRAGFAATWCEIQRDLADDPQAAVGRLLDGRARADGIVEGFEAVAARLAEAAVAAGDINRLKAWWLYRMLFSPDPLGERLALMWHNHFATGNDKVKDVGLMHRQNEMLRRLARRRFGELLAEMSRDPALLIYLDAPANRGGRPNENLARELMELFTLGIGHYTEDDVKEAARALTGVAVVNGQFRPRPDWHDPGEKTILGRRGRWGGDDLLRILLEHPAAARRIARRVCSEFMGEGAVDDAALDELAAGLRERELDVGWAVETVLRSHRFFAEANLRTRVSGPVEFVVGAARALEVFSPPPSTLALAEWAARMGQDLMHPPNVGGWPGGRAWLTSRTIVARGNFADALVRGNLTSPPSPFDLAALAARHGRGATQDQAVRFYQELLLGGGGEVRSKGLGPAVIAILAGPEAQLS